MSSDIEVIRSPELVFGLVAPIGTDAGMVAENLKSQLSEFGYKSSIIRLSEYIGPVSELLELECKLDFTSEFKRIRSHITAANNAYRKFNELADSANRNSMLALAAAERISAARKERGDPDALLNEAHILVTLKRSEEVAALRSIYGRGFHLIGVFAPEDERIEYLRRKDEMSKEDARELVDIDANDRQQGGQRTGEAFHLADVFLDVGTQREEWKNQLGRFLNILFSHPYETPTRDEQAMFMAFSASLRSAQFGRQVGAAITSKEGDILAVGCNEVPKAGGGEYWSEDLHDQRDHSIGRDSNDARKSQILAEILGTLPKGQEKLDEIKEAIKKTSLFSITEFGRAVHAEMEAILTCSRMGISTVGRTLYTTTFPCHNCARHIIGAGITRVVYVEPYPKSKAKELHEDAIAIGESARVETKGRIPFVPFVGISPSKYSELFTSKPMYSQEVSRKLTGGRAISWQRSRAQLRTSMVPISYVEREVRAISSLQKTFSLDPNEDNGKLGD